MSLKCLNCLTGCSHCSHCYLLSHKLKVLLKCRPSRKQHENKAGGVNPFAINQNATVLHKTKGKTLASPFHPSSQN